MTIFIGVPYKFCRLIFGIDPVHNNAKDINSINKQEYQIKYKITSLNSLNNRLVRMDKSNINIQTLNYKINYNLAQKIYLT